ncbi:MAG TPA: LuxR C-terminal-related transcriptional regulator [Anaerolineaceae bacterium]|jgi:LuxR family maltose regulon positive regulatory protein
MPAHIRILVANASLQIEPSTIPVGSDEWFAWLSQHTRFSFQGKNGHFVAQCETRRRKTFWYAYRRRNGRLYKQYLGKSAELTTERLEQAADALAGKTLLDQYENQPAGDPLFSEKARIDTSFLPLTKIHLPALPLHLVSRPRLTRQINTPLTLIYAPSGFGKSPLLNDWKQTCGHPVAWLSLDEGDNHPIRFWCSVINALQTIHPDFGKGLLAYLQTAPQIHLGEVVAWLTHTLVDPKASIARMSLVLDDFHRIHTPEILDSIQTWLEHFPPNLQLIISGHTKPPLSLGHLRAKGFLTEIDANDLRFTLEEGIAYLQQYPQDPPLAYTDLEKLVKHAEGWAAGLTLIALALGKQADRRQFIDTFSGAHIYLREYFMETVLQHSSPEVQVFLFKTAVLKQLNASLCDAVTGRTDGEEMLAGLRRDNLFVAQLDVPGWYRYQDLFAEMLLSQLQARFPDEVTSLHQRAARWFRGHLAPASAVYHLLACGAWEEAASLMEEMALRELGQFGEDSRLLRWLQELPEEIVQRHKTLLFVYLRLADVALPQQKIERFIERLDSNISRKPFGQQSVDEREVLVEIGRIRRTWEQGDSFTPPTRGDRENDARWELLNGLHLLKLGYGTDPGLLENQLTHLLQQAQAQHNLFVVLMVGGALARQAYASGQLRRAEKIARQVLEQALIERRQLPETASIALAALSQISLERNELEQAQKYLSQAQQVDPNPTSTNMLIQTGVQRSLLQAAQGNLDAALANIQAIHTLQTRQPSRTWTEQDLLAYQADICLRKGDLLRAGQILSESESRGEHALSQLVRAEFFLKVKQAGDAERILSALVEQHPHGFYFEPLVRARFLLAMAFYDQHKMNQALQTCVEALRSAAPEHILRPFLEWDASCIPLLLLTLKTGRITKAAEGLITEIFRSLGGAPENFHTHLDALSTSASISRREQDILGLLSNGYSNREIAEKLCISESTVKTHLGNLYHKLGVNSRLQAVKTAKELTLVR